MDKVSFCPLHKWNIIKLRGLVENVPRENIIVAGPEELLPEKDFLKEQAQYRNEGNKDTNGMVRKNDVVKEPSKNEVKKNLSKREGNTEPAMTEINKKPGSTENNTEPAMKETKNKPENNDVNNEEAMKEVKNEFAENVEDYFCCPICFEFAEDAVEASCCHKILCEKCVRGQKICPMCRENPFGFAPSHFARLFIGNLKTSCQNEGCDEQPTRSNLQYHLKKCEFQLVKCQSLYCDVSVLRSHLPKHALECDYRRMDCENPGCFSSFSAYGAAQHEQECLFTTVKCQNAGCDALMFRKDVETHLKFDCRFEIVVCPAPGCSFRNTSANVGHHLVDAHFQYFKKKNFVNTM